MGNDTKKQLFLIFGLTVFFGTCSYLLALQVDKTVADVAKIRNEIDELTRIAAGSKEKIKEFQSIETYGQNIDENLPKISDITEILGQLEIIAQLNSVDLTIKLEEGVIGEGEIEFKDTKEKDEFLQSLELKEYTTESATSSTDGAASDNVALQMMQQGTSQSESILTINYLEIDLNVKSTYDDIRAFIELLQGSKYFFNIEEIKLSKIEGGVVEGSIKVRAFIFER